MRAFMKSMAVVAALALAYAQACAETTKIQTVSHAAVASGFADSFGLNLAERAAATKQRAAPTSEQRWVPVADSFGLNNVLVSAMADCLAAKMAQSTARSHRCIEM